jgi:hypothetical protein
MGNRHDSLPTRFPQLFHSCSFCRSVGLKPGILATKHGDYGMRSTFEDERELVLNKVGVCKECADQLDMGA